MRIFERKVCFEMVFSIKEIVRKIWQFMKNLWKTLSNPLYIKHKNLYQNLRRKKLKLFHFDIKYSIIQKDVEVHFSDGIFMKILKIC